LAELKIIFNFSRSLFSKPKAGRIGHKIRQISASFRLVASSSRAESCASARHIPHCMPGGAAEIPALLLA
jgi:hypothetical protein